ncbi:hypothetical protein EES47_07115 [Streptomyces sp. ADI98-12]|nr:hypothetical protein EES47_07115 [Streptomyces sp. ADI98-12]
MWCIERTSTVAPSHASRTTRTRAGGPVRRSNGVACSAASTRRSSSSPSASTARRGSGSAVCTVCAPSAKVVRSGSCRATRASSAVRSAVRSSPPATRSARPVLYSTPPGVNSSRNHRRSCPGESGSRAPSRGTAGITPPGSTAPPAPFRVSTAASRAGVGWSKRARAGRSAPSVRRSREVAFRAATESPPSAKKSSSAPARSIPRRSAHRSHRARSVLPRGATYAAAAVVPGAGRARWSIFPLGVSGSASRVTKAAGTMYSGSVRASRARRAAGSCGVAATR